MKAPTKKELQAQLAKAKRHNQALIIAIKELGCLAQYGPAVVHPVCSSRIMKALGKISKLIRPRK